MPRDLPFDMEQDNLRERLSKYTRRAFQALPKLEKPFILDIGCGSGVPTIELARLSNGEIIGIDVNRELLEKLSRKIEKKGFSDRVKAVRCSLFEISFANESFDVIWAEGSISVIGFERGLKEWRRLLGHRGFLVVHTETKNMSTKLGKIPNWGYKLLYWFPLPEDAHWLEYYEPLEVRIEELQSKYENNPEALHVLRKKQNEVEMVKRDPKQYSSAFYIIQKL